MTVGFRINFPKGEVMSANRLWAGILVIVLMSASLAVPALAETITIDLSQSPNPPVCDVDWQQGNCMLCYVSTTAEDAVGAGYCIVTWVDVSAGTGTYVMGGRIEVDLTNIEGITSVEIDVYEAHMAGSTRAFLYTGATPSGSASSTTTLAQTITLSAPPEADRLAISAQEAGIWTIRLIGNTLVENQDSTWGRIKAMY